MAKKQVVACDAVGCERENAMECEFFSHADCGEAFFYTVDLCPEHMRMAFELAANSVRAQDKDGEQLKRIAQSLGIRWRIK